MLQRAWRFDPDGDGPLEVQLLELPSQDALDRYLADDRRTALGEGREAAIARTEVQRVELS